MLERPPSIDALARSIGGDLPLPLRVDAARASVAAGRPEDASVYAQAIEDALLGAVLNATGVSFVGLAPAVADVASFGRSPGATADGLLDAMEVDGLRFPFVGRPVASERVEGATVMSTDKHHTMRYATERVLELLDLHCAKSLA